MTYKMQHDPEPERYYDWMLWKMRQERTMEDPVDDVTVGNNLRGWTESNRPFMTREDMYKKEIAMMQEQVHTLQMKIVELQEKLKDAVL